MKKLWEDEKDAKSWREKETKNVDLGFDTFFIFTPLKNNDLVVRLGERKQIVLVAGR